MAKTYRIDPNKLPKARFRMMRNVVIRTVVRFISFVALFLFVMVFGGLIADVPEILNSPPASRGPISTWLLAIYVVVVFYLALLPVWGGPLVGFVILFAALDFRSIRRRLRALASVEIELEADTAVRRVLGAEESRISREETTYLQAHPDGFVVMTEDESRGLGVPDTLADYEELLAAFQEWGVLRPFSFSTWLQRSGYPRGLRGLLPVTGVALVFISDVPVVMVLGAMLLIGSEGWYYWNTRRDMALKHQYITLAIVGAAVLVTAFRLYRVTR